MRHREIRYATGSPSDRMPSKAPRAEAGMRQDLMTLIFVNGNRKLISCRPRTGQYSVAADNFFSCETAH
jgi:hypothetical protein